MDVQPPVRRVMPNSSDIRVDLLLETGGGGSGRHVLNLYHGLRRSGWDAHLILSSRRAEPGFAAEVEEIPSEHVTFLDIRRSPHMSDVPAIARLRRSVKRAGRRHLLHAHSTKAGILGWALGDAVSCRVLTPHAYRGMDPTLTGWRRTAIRRAESLFSTAYDAVIAVSPDERDYVASLGVKPGRIHYIPNGVDVEHIAGTADRVRRLRTPGAPPSVGFVGRLVTQKNPTLFLDMMRVLVERGSPVQAMIVGDGPLKPGLMEKAQSYGVAHLIEWRGNVPAVEELGNMDVMVHTSHYESFPYTLLESVAASLPIVTVENAGSRAILGDRFAEAIVAEPTAEALADAVLRVLAEGPVPVRHLEAFGAIGQDFSMSNMVKRTVEVYEAALRGVGVQ